MATKGERSLALFFAIIFFASSIGVASLVVFQVKKENDNKKQQQQLIDAAKQQTALTPADTTSKTSAQDTTKKTDTTKPKEGQLQGTKLANFEVTTGVSELQIIDTVVGTGDEVPAGATVTVHYTGAVAATGIIFQSSKDTGQQATFPLANVIKGWTQGIPGMKVGGTRRLLIPAALAYGANPPQGAGIPANADLVFDVELSAVQK